MTYEPTTNEYQEIIQLWHIARTALAGQSCSRYDRLQYVSREFRKVHPDTRPVPFWLYLSDTFRGY